MWRKWVANIIKKDWTEHGKVFLMFFVGMLLVVFLPNEETRYQTMAGALLGIGFSYAYYVFTWERMHGTLDMLVGLPVPPAAILLGKFASLFTLCLATVVLPAVLTPDHRMMFLLLTLLLFVATACMACNVFIKNRGAALVPLLLIGVAFQRPNLYTEFQPYQYRVAGGALLLIPFIVVACVFEFRRQTAV